MSTVTGVLSTATGISPFAPNPKLGKEALVKALARVQAHPALPAFSRIDAGKARVSRLREVIASEPGDVTPGPFVPSLAAVHWYSAFPICDISELGHIMDTPVWLFDHTLATAFEGGGELPENYAVLHPHIGFSHFVSEILYEGKKLLLLRLKAAKNLENAKLMNVVLVLAHENQPSYEEILGSVTRYSVEDLLPEGLLLDD